MEIPWKSSCNVNELPIEISMKYKWKSIENPVEISMKLFNDMNANTCTIIFPYRAVPWESSCNSIEIPMKYQMKTIGNPVEISMKYKWKSIINPAGI